MRPKIVISQCKKHANVYLTYLNRDGIVEHRMFKAYSSAGNVLDIVILLISPINTNKDITFNSYINSLEDTINITLDKVG